MSAHMSEFLTGDLSGPLGTVVHIGAGQGAALPAYRAAGATRIVLVEPDPDALAVLRPLMAGAKDVTLMAGAATCVTGPVHLTRFSFAALNSLRAPTGLTTLFPGLEEIARIEVRAVDPVALVADLNLADASQQTQGLNLLTLEASGEAFDILTAMAGAGHLARFDRIVVQEGRAVLYEGAAPMDDIAALLREAGFTALVRDTADPDRPTVRMDRDPHIEALAVLTRERDDLARDAKALAQERDAAKAEIATLGRTHAEALAAMAREQETKVQMLEAQLAIQLEALRETGDSLKEALSTQRETPAPQDAGQKQENAALKSRVKDLEADHADMITRAALIGDAQENLLRAEGQITLISDLLIRVPLL